ncbi:hypothetical protein F0562_010672 [Nyssa sinensis]|uniref:Chromo domain-containing protein n=1 Tax=Nyssa sinensis TaxID=561372 RepID=A0A5J5A1S9_9ASTE|nr:hypothetical protein F0562_010672 [Nyssa sinensis]
MAERTRLVHLSNIVNTLHGETVSLKEEQSRQGMLIERVLQQLNNLVQITTKLSSEEGTSNNVKLNANPLFVGHTGIQARSLRLDFPRFDDGDPSEWILKAQQFFNYFETPDNHKLEIASFHIEGKALTWYYWLKESSPRIKWEDFLEALHIRFRLSAYKDPMGAFTKLRRAKLPVEEGHLAVQVANGDTLPCLGCHKTVLLKGLRLPEKAIEEERSLSKAAIVNGRGIWLQLMKLCEKSGETPIEPAIQAVLNNLKTVFAERRGLPPPKSHDHQIQLQETAKPMSVIVRKGLKLSPRYFGPFQIIQKIGEVTYKLDLPKESKIYPVFHISCLKKKLGTLVNPSHRLPIVMENSTMAPEPEKILERRLKKNGNRARVDLLVQWKRVNKEDATWVDAEELCKTYPELVGEFF